MDGLAAAAERMAQIRSGLALMAPRPTPAQSFPTWLTDAVSAATASPPHRRHLLHQDDRQRLQFEAQLAAAAARAVTQPASPGRTDSASAPGRVGELTTAGVSVDLAGYGNGKIPASALSPVGRGSHRLWAPAAEGFIRLLAAAERDGVEIRVHRLLPLLRLPGRSRPA